MDLEDIRKHIDDLAKSPMNGRQIRNCITTARQLARFKQKPMDYETLKHVIKVSQRFDDYLNEVHDGADDEDWAREERVR